VSYTGSFSSPNYPWYYPNNADCRFQIKVPARRHIIALNIFNFDTEAGYDFLKVRLCCAKKSLKIPKGYLGIIKLLNLCSIYTFILKSMLFAMLIKTARLQSHYCLYLMVPIAILFNVLIGYGINVHGKLNIN
jgi:hypothetical protein